MKKIYKIITLLLVVVFLAGCAANADVKNNDDSVSNKVTFRITNYYDKVFYHVEYIPEVIDMINIIYGIEFDSKIQFENVDVLLDEISGVNKCKRGSFCSTLDCGSECAQHHKNIYNIINNISAEQVDDDQIGIYWADDRIYCLGEEVIDGKKVHYGNFFNTELKYTFSQRDNPVILFIANANGASFTYKEYMTVTVLKELAYMFGMTEEEIEGISHGEECILDKFSLSPSSIVEKYAIILSKPDSVYCAECTKVLEEKIYDYIERNK